MAGLSNWRYSCVEEKNRSIRPGTLREGTRGPNVCFSLLSFPFLLLLQKILIKIRLLYAKISSLCAHQTLCFFQDLFSKLDSFGKKKKSAHLLLEL